MDWLLLPSFIIIMNFINAIKNFFNRVNNHVLKVQKHAKKHVKTHPFHYTVGMAIMGIMFSAFGFAMFNGGFQTFGQVAVDPLCGKILDGTDLSSQGVTLSNLSIDFDGTTKTYTLHQDVDCSSYVDGPALTIGADGITLDLNTHNIKGMVNALAWRPLITLDTHNGVTIKNGTLTTQGASYGIYAHKANNFTLQDLTIAPPTGDGIGGGSAGILLSSSSTSTMDGITLQNVHVERHTYGLLFSEGAFSHVSVLNSSFNNNGF